MSRMIALLVVTVLFGAACGGAGDPQGPPPTTPPSASTPTASTPTATVSPTAPSPRTSAPRPTEPRPTSPPTTGPTTESPSPDEECDPNYSGCVPIADDVDCAGGDGDGPEFVQGPVRVLGEDKYELDRDGDGVGCE